MKKAGKIIGLCAIIASLAVSHVPPVVMAAGDSVAVSESEAMEAVLIKVKEKVEIPEELTKFSSGMDRYSESRKYRFEWSDKDYSRNLVIYCDSEGRIQSYSKYDYSDEKQPGYIGVTREQALSLAEEFLMKIAPEAFANENDRLVYEKHSFDNNYSASAYNFTFVRYRDGNRVRFGTAEVTVAVNGDRMEVERANIPFDYDAVFETAATEIADPTAAYEQAFPMELIYTDNYKKAQIRNGEPEKEVRLIYRIENNDSEYISAYTGEVLENSENEAVPLYSKNEMATADTAASAEGSRLTPAELEEIEQISSLKSEEECLEYLKDIPMLQMADMNATEKFSTLYETDSEKGEYIRFFNYIDANDDREVYANIDAVRGRLTYFYDGSPKLYATEEPLTEAEIAETNEQTDKFLNIVAADVIDEFEREENNEHYSEGSRRYVRVANGIPYVSDSIFVEYSAGKDRILNYSLDYDNYAEFADPSEVIEAKKAYQALFEAAPLEKGYVKFDGEYRLAYYTSSRPLIDAFTGKKMVEAAAEYVPQEVVYSDTDNHWSRNSVNFLKDMGIAFDGPQLRPDDMITQSDLLRLFAAGVSGNWYMTYDIESVYNRCYSMDILTEAERSDDAILTREQAFIYMVRFAGYDTVAKLPDIYKVKYADGDMLSEGAIGYAAILSGMGIINGDGSTIRPKDYITRAEAITMVYNYLTSPIR